MNIEVTKEDIKKGIRLDCDRCAISQALKRHFKTDNVSTELDGGDIVLTVGSKVFSVGYQYESDVLDFIYDFDQVDGWSKVEPIEFELIETYPGDTQEIREAK